MDMDFGLAWPVSSEISSGSKSSRSDWMTVLRPLEFVNLPYRDAMDAFALPMCSYISHLVPDFGVRAVNWNQEETSRNGSILQKMANVLDLALHDPSAKSCCYTFLHALSQSICLPGGSWFVALCIQCTAL